MRALAKLLVLEKAKKKTIPLIRKLLQVADCNPFPGLRVASGPLEARHHCLP